MEQARRTYPNELIKKCQKLILERSGKKITKDTAELYLEKLSRYYMLAVKVLDQEEKAKKK
jgi:hypothetical protein